MRTHNKKKASLSQSPAKLLLAVAASIFVCETVVMLLAFLSPFESHWIHALLDSAFLLILLSPVLYFFLFRPFSSRIEEYKQVKAALQRSREDLEERVEERTKALEKANRKMDKALQERLKAEERFRNIAEMSPNMIFINWRGHVVYANEQSTKTMGYRREEFYSPQFDFLSLIAPESVSRVKKNLERHMTGEEVAPYEVTLVTRNGRRLETIVSTRLIDIEGDKAILGIITDISDQKRRQERIRESETRFRAVAQSAKDAIITVDGEGKIVFCNRSALEMFGYEKQEVLGREVTLLIPEELKNAHLQGMARFREMGALMKPGRIVETAGLRKGSQEFPLEFTLSTWESNGRPHCTAILRDITRRRESEERLRRNYDMEKATNTLLRISLEDSSLKEILTHSLDLILSIRWLSLESQGCIFLVEADEPSLMMSAQNALDQNIQQACHRLPFGKCLCGRAASTQEMVFSDCIDERHDITYAGMVPHGHYCVPILHGGKTLGVINLYVKEGHQWDAAEAGFLTAVADTLAGVIRRKQSEEKLADTLEHLRQMLDRTVALLSTITERRDPYTAGHQRRVTKLGRAIATEMGLSKEQVEGVGTAAILHDIGKIAVPLEILTKSTRLTDIEFQFIKTHPQAGYDFLKGIPFSRPVAQIIYQHHERLDGSGYPLALKGDEIRLEARILAVSDVVEAMASDRPYRPALGSDTALEEISKNSGILYEPGVVDACLRLFKDKGFTFEEE